MVRKWPGLLVAGALLAALLPASTLARDPFTRTATPLPDRIAAQKLAQPISLDAAATSKLMATKVAATLRGATGSQRVIVRLSAPPAIQQIDNGKAKQKAAYAVARAQQLKVIAKAKILDKQAKVLGRTGMASNVVMLKTDARTLSRLAKDPAVVAIVPVKDYTLDLSETVPYVGAKIVQAAGWKGQGVDVAVLDTGIDYTHAAFGGAGTEAAFKAAYGTTTTDPKNTSPDGLFPTARVKGGYDFVGEAWNGAADSPSEAPDPDPIDSPDAGTALGAAMGTEGGHGTHVADIIGGTKGMAPRVNLFAVKVCSSVATSCSGVALMNAMEWAMDPNADGFLTDHVDIINMSLGSDYGTVADDDLTLAVERATHYAGILTVAASGNGGNKPYISGTPAAAPSALSVAQTQVPSAKKYPLVVSAPSAIAGTYKNVETVDWAPLGAGFTNGDVVYVGGNGCPGDPSYPGVGTLTGKVALIDRGACAVSFKTDGAAKAGAIGVLIGLVAPGDAISFSFGGGDTFVPTLVIQQSLASAIKAQLAVPAAVTVSVSSATFVRLVGGLAGSSSRGPSSANRIKPEIGAPGASVSAVSGSGSQTQAFGGTSGATPMVTGAAALIKGAFPKRSALEIKALLMNTAETTVYTDNALQPGVLAPITRIGGGELRVSRALKSPIAVWDAAGQSGSLSFGFVDGTRTLTITRKLTVRNYTTKTRTFAIKPIFRYANDKSNGAVKITAPTSVRLTSRQTKIITVTATIYASKLRPWTMNGGEFGTDPTKLDLMEYDGYINFDQTSTTADNADPVHVAWQVLPRKSSDLRPSTTSVSLTDGMAILALQNVGAGSGAIEGFSLVGTSPDKPAARPGMNSPVIDLKAVGVQTYPVPVDFCGATESFLYRIAISAWDRQTTAIVPGELDVDLDTNHDGTPDFNVFAAPVSASDGRAVTWVFDYATKTLDAQWFAEHGTNDSNTILTFCGDQVGLDATAFGSPWTMDVTAYDSYYRNFAVTDSITGIEVAPLAERYAGFADTSDGDVAALTTADFNVLDWTVLEPYPYPTNGSETGVLLVTNGDRGSYVGGAPRGREAIQFVVAP